MDGVAYPLLKISWDIFFISQQIISSQQTQNMYI